MPIRQVEIVGCDVCGVEAVHTRNNPAQAQTAGWIALGKATLAIYGHQQGDVTGHFCSVTCLVQYFRNRLTGTQANVAPVNYVDGEGNTE